MMRIWLRTLLAGVAVTILSGCMYTSVGMPLDTDLDRTQLGSKRGEASMQSVLWAVAWGDAGTEAAAHNGGITTINHADRKRLVVFFGIYAKETLIVYGD